LIDKIQAISKKLGGQHAKSAQEMVESGNTKGWIEAVLVYYDKTYSYSAEKNKERTKLLDFEWETEESIMSSTNAIIELIKELY
jgi:hypothetical protein